MTDHSPATKAAHTNATERDGADGLSESGADGLARLRLLWTQQGSAAVPGKEK